MQERHEELTRRGFMGRVAAVSAATAGLAGIAHAEQYIPGDVDDYDFLIARVGNNNPDWEYFPGGDKNLLEQLSHVLRIKVKIQPNTRDENPERGKPEHFNAMVDLTSIDDLRKFPFLFMTGMGVYRLGQTQTENLRDYVCSGGFVLMDECAHPGRADDFYQSAYLSLVSAFGQEAIRPIPEDHEIYRNVYDISQPNYRRWVRTGVPSPGNVGVFIEDRLAVVLCDADIHCGWTDPRNSWIKRAHHEESIRTGINIVAYALSH
ncbi:MAG: hypothetical protein AMXMBFR82_43180 [Candidatus Hydrogenedentota bacterium]